MHQALYYPWIDIRDEAWLKTSLLYWDSVRTIVPEAIDDPYSSRTGKVLEEAGFLVPFRVHSSMEVIEGLTEDVLRYLSSPEELGLMVSEDVGHRSPIHVQKLPFAMGELANIHPQKLPSAI